MFKEVVDANFNYKYWHQLSDGRLIIGGFTGHGLGFAAGSSKVAAELWLMGSQKRPICSILNDLILKEEHRIWHKL